MNTTHIGKIGRLPKSVRDELGRRIEDGVPGKDLVKWLNELPEVQEAMKELFDGRAIIEQNLSDWKQTGHPEWLRGEEGRLRAGWLAERADELEEAAPGLSDHLARLLAAEAARVAMVLAEQESDPEKRLKHICKAHREISQTRRDDHRETRTEILRERWNRQVEHEEMAELEKMKEDHKERMTRKVLSAAHQNTMAKAFGGGKHGKMVAEMLYRIEHDEPLDDLVPPAEKPDKAKPIKANKA